MIRPYDIHEKLTRIQVMVKVSKKVTLGEFIASILGHAGGFFNRTKDKDWNSQRMD